MSFLNQETRAAYENGPNHPGNDLSDSLIRENLSCLGKHPFLLSHAYLSFKATGKSICNIENIKNYPNLMYINLSDNLIDNLRPLDSLVALVQLTLRNNRLKDCLVFAPKRCTKDAAWSSGEKAVGSMLAMADLTGNQISIIDNLYQHKFLECLILSSNAISKISGLQNLKYLQVLDLSFNKIKTVEGLKGLLITELNLEGNEIVSLNGLTANPRLSVLNVASNKITSLAPLLSFVQLYNLNASGNHISYIRQVEFLEEMQWLKNLNLADNPCCEKQYYRARVVFRLPFLQLLDGNTVSAEEKIRACNLYNSEGGDLQYREEVFMKNYPEEQFKNFSPYFEDDELNLILSDLYDECSNDVITNHSNISNEEYDIVKQFSSNFLFEVMGNIHRS